MLLIKGNYVFISQKRRCVPASVKARLLKLRAVLLAGSCHDVWKRPSKALYLSNRWIPCQHMADRPKQMETRVTVDQVLYSCCIFGMFRCFGKWRRVTWLLGSPHSPRWQKDWALKFRDWLFSSLSHWLWKLRAILWFWSTLTWLVVL